MLAHLYVRQKYLSSTTARKQIGIPILKPPWALRVAFSPFPLNDMSVQIGFKRIHKVAYGFTNMIIKGDTLSENDLAAPPHSGVGGFEAFRKGYPRSIFY